jgi:hypothetical protein
MKKTIDKPGEPSSMWSFEEQDQAPRKDSWCVPSNFKVTFGVKFGKITQRQGWQLKLWTA